MTAIQIHLFDIDVKGGVRFKESETLSAGNKLSILNLEGLRIGLGICYDIRFEELARIYRNNGNVNLILSEFPLRLPLTPYVDINAIKFIFI